MSRLRAGVSDHLRLLLPRAQGQARDESTTRRHDCHEFWALRDVTLEVRRGECLGIIGRNGSGKSTLLQLIAGILRPSHGSILTRGRIAALLELGSGFNPEFSGRENVYLNASIHGLTRRQVDDRFDEIAAFAEIGDFMDRPVKTYSSGMVVRLAFGVLAHIDADILIIDEALAVGDALFVQKCMRWLQHFLERHTALLVSHDMSAITRFCTRGVWLHEGRLQYDGPPRIATEKYLEAMYGPSQGGQGTVLGDDANRVDRLSPEAAERIAARRDRALASEGIEVFPFDPDAASFGDIQAVIEDVSLLSESGDRCRVISGGESITCRILFRAETTVVSPIVGFGLKNRQGQELFHENTYLTSFLSDEKPMTLAAGERAVARFSFVMPYLPPGDYFLFAAVATGTHEEHRQQHWVHEALHIQSVCPRICLGLIGLPMLDVSLERIDANRGEDQP